MATVFERLEEKMAKLIETIEEMKSAIKKNSSSIETIRKDMNSAFLDFSDFVGNRLAELQESIKSAPRGPGSGSLSPDLTNFTREMKIITNQLRNMLETTIEKIRQTMVSSVKPDTVTKTTFREAPPTFREAPPQPIKKIKPESKELLAPVKRATVPIKGGKTVPMEALDLLDSLKTKIEYPAVKFALIMEQVRDEIVKKYKFHPAIYEIGTFARKLKKYPPNMKIDPDVLTLLFDKIDEWKRRIGGLE